MSLPRVTYDDAADFLLEAAWEFEDRYLWRAERALGQRAEVAQEALDEALERAQRAVEPLQRLIQTKVTWPVGDAIRERGTAARAGIATAAAASAIAAGVAGATVAAPGDSPAPAPASQAAAGPAAPLVQTASAPQVLQGPAPEIELGDATVKPPPPAPPAPPAPPTAPATATAEPPARVAWRFAQAFVLYEVGKSDAKTAATFTETADPVLAKSLATSPPRLPSGTEVPEARVLNVVLAEREEKQVTASVSLARLRAVSEVRLTLSQDKKGVWRVVQVLG